MRIFAVELLLDGGHGILRGDVAGPENVKTRSGGSNPVRKTAANLVHALILV